MKIFEPYFTDASKETAIDLSISPIKAVGVAPTYIVDYGDDFYSETPGGVKITPGGTTAKVVTPVVTPSNSTSPKVVSVSLTGWQKPDRSVAIPYNVVQGKNVGHMKAVTDLFDKHGIQYRISSGVRNHRVGTSGGRSWHLAGRGLDIAAPEGMSNDDFIRQFVGNKALLDEMKALNYGIINEYIAANRKKTGATGPHLHIGPDTWAWQNHAEFYNPNMALYGQKGVKIPEIKKEMADQYTKGAWKLEKLSNELSIFPKSGSVLSQAIVDRLNNTNVAYPSSDIDGDPNIAGMYNKLTGDVVVREDAGRNTIVHELAHASNPELQKARIAQLKKLYGNQLYKHKGQAPSDYLDSEGEIYARLKATCDSLGIDLSKDYTDEELDKIFLKASKGKTYRYLLEGGDGSRTVKTIEVDEDGNATSNTPTPRGAKIVEQSVSQVFEGDDNMLNRYNPRFIKTLIKELVSVDPKKDNTRRV